MHPPVLGRIVGIAVIAALSWTTPALAQHHPAPTGPILLTADRVFDGERMRTGVGVLVRDGKVAAVGDPAALRAPDVREIARPGGTILPGFIDLHTHHTFNGVPLARVLEHGVTTVRDLGGALQPSGGMREVLAGPMLTAPRGYPIPVFKGTERTVRGTRQARAAVRDLVHHGAGVIKVSLEPGGSPGAPWSHHAPSDDPPWPMLKPRELKAIVDEAHKHGRKVAAHLSGREGVELALDAGVDEWSHVPCDRVPGRLLRRAVRAKVAIVGTLDTQAHCRGVAENANQIVALGGRILYGTDLAHVEIPHGIDAQELHLMLGAGMTIRQVLRAATGWAGEHLGQAPLGTLVPGAPADAIVVAGDPTKVLKALEYPYVVLHGGTPVIEKVLPTTSGDGHGHGHG